MTVALSALAISTAEAQDLAATLEKLHAETRRGLPLGAAMGTRTGRHDHGNGAAGKRQGITEERTAAGTGTAGAGEGRRNARSDRSGRDTNRVMSTLGCVGAVDHAVRSARQPGTRRIHRAQNILWRAQVGAPSVRWRRQRSLKDKARQLVTTAAHERPRPKERLRG